MSFLLSLVLLLGSPVVFGESAKEAVKNALATPSTLEPLMGETLKIKPIANHHFNLEAPQDCGKEATMDPSAKVIACQFQTAGSKEIVVSVCDDPKKYCKQEYFKVEVQNIQSSESRMIVPPTVETAKMQKELKEKIMKGFQFLQPEDARKLAQGKKGVLVVSSADWCPPCNKAKEFLFSQERFSQVTKDLLLVYVDGDSPKATSWGPILKSYYYPSFILLNSQLEPLALKTGYMVLSDLEEWLKSGLKESLTLKELESAVVKRMDGEWMQKVWDLFESQKTIQGQALRMAKVFNKRNQQEKAIQLFKSFSLDEMKSDILMWEYMDLAFQEEPSDADKKRKAEVAEDLLRNIEKDPQAGLMAISTFCGQKEISEDLKSLCLQAIDQAAPANEKRIREKWDVLSDGEKALKMAGHSKTLVKLRKVHHQLDASSPKDSGKACFLAHESLKKLSPLGEKSRVARLGQIGCGSEGGNKTAKVLKSLIKDFPFEETFYRKLAGIKLKEKQYRQALELNASALKYSYGGLWLSNLVSRAEILEKMKRSKEAFQLLKDNMQEVRFREDGRYSWVFDKFRSQYEKLKKEVAI